MPVEVKSKEKMLETDVLILGSGAAGCGAAMAAKGKGAKVLMLDKGKLESSGCLGGGNDHFSGGRSELTQIHQHLGGNGNRGDRQCRADKQGLRQPNIRPGQKEPAQ